MIGPTIHDRQREASAATNPVPGELQRRRLLREGWSEGCLDSERRFGSRVARLYPLVGVRGGIETPLGQGTLLQAIADSPGRPGAMVEHVHPRAFFWDDGKKRAAAVFVAVENVKPYRKGNR